MLFVAEPTAMVSAAGLVVELTPEDSDSSVAVNEEIFCTVGIYYVHRTLKTCRFYLMRFSVIVSSPSARSRQLRVRVRCKIPD